MTAVLRSYGEGRRRGHSALAPEDERVRSIVRLRLSTGRLGPMNQHACFWPEYGWGEPCVVCGAVIGGAELQYVSEGPGGRAVAHLVCFTMWQKESEQFTASELR